MRGLQVVSGGQTGVDRAALDAALELGWPCGGWCPRGRLAEDGPLDERYPLGETPTSVYAERTFWNVRDSDGTLIICFGALTGGTAYTVDCARRLAKPWLELNLETSPDPAELGAWVSREGIATLNVAGPRGSSDPRVYPRARAFLVSAFRSFSIST
jgi:hypothetical protein